MIPLASQRHAGRVLRHLRETMRLSQRQVAERLFVRHTAVSNRELGVRDLTAQALIDTAHVLGYDLALIRRTTRATGTGWPA